MPNSKSADLRIKVIDRCLSDKRRKYSTAEMFALCNEELLKHDFHPITSLNSVRNDIEQIERMYHPYADVESFREGRNIYYHYADPDFSIYSPPLNSDEVVQLTQMLGLLNRFRGMPQFDWLDQVTDRLGASLKIDVASAEEIVGYDENLDLKGIEYFTPLFNAIIDKQPLKLTYKSFKYDDELIITVHPYYLKQYNKRWFLIAWNADSNFLANYAFDRIVRIDKAPVPYRPTDINFFEYFDEMIGVSKDTRTEPQLVKLWVSLDAWPYVKTKPFHGTQRVVSVDEDGAIITIEVYLNYELQQLLLSYGESVMVLEPKELQDKIKERLTKAFDLYEK